MARVPSALLRNWQLKLSALGLSIFLWALVQTEPLSEETFSSVPVVVEVLDTAWSLAADPDPETVELRLGGPAREIIRLVRDGTTVRVPITAVSSRDTVVTLQREWVELGQRAGLTVESLSPPTLTLSFEPAMTKAVPISRRVQGQLPPDLAFSADLRVDPEAAEVRGPESRVAGLDSIPLAPLDLSRIRDSEIVTLAIDTSGLGGASVTPPDAMVGVRVEPRIERTLDNRPVRVNVPEPGIELRVEPASVRVQLSGARSLVTTMDLTLLRVSVPAASLAGMIPGEERRVPIRIDGVPRLVTARSSTDAVTVVRTMAPSGGVPRDPS
ncbi:MAG: YbbR-like domain-containing protein [Gemmatimonadota bacterium]|jgi:hypothetical protein